MPVLGCQFALALYNKHLVLYDFSVLSAFQWSSLLLFLCEQLAKGSTHGLILHSIPAGLLIMLCTQ